MVFLRLKRLLHLPENVADNNPWPELYLNDGEYPVARVQHNMINAQDGVGGFRLVFMGDEHNKRGVISVSALNLIMEDGIQDGDAVWRVVDGKPSLVVGKGKNYPVHCFSNSFPNDPTRSASTITTFNTVGKISGHHAGGLAMNV